MVLENNSHSRPNNLTLQSSLGTGEITCSVISSMIAVFVIFENMIALLAVCASKMERQRKQITTLLAADVVVGLLCIPITIMQFLRIELLLERNVCFLSMGLTDWGLLNQNFAVAGMLFMMLATLKYPLRCHSLQSWEPRIIFLQCLFPFLFMFVLTFSTMSFEGNYKVISCNWGTMTDWYSYSHTAILFPTLSSGFISGGLVICLAFKQASAVTSQFPSSNSTVEAKAKESYSKQARHLKIAAVAFVFVWIPYTVTVVVLFAVPGIDAGSIPVFMAYNTVSGVGSTLPVIYTLSFPDVRSELRLRMCH